MENKTTYTEEIEQELHEAEKLMIEQETDTPIAFTNQSGILLSLFCC